MRSGEEIQRALTKFQKKWITYSGSEKGEAQTFLNQLFDAYGSDRLEVGAQFEAFKSSAGFMDLHWPGICIVEMKAPHIAVSEAREQVKRYWEESADDAANIPAAAWVVLCNFREFEIWEPGRFPKSARAAFALEDLPSRYETLMFLAGTDQRPNFSQLHKKLTTKAADKVGEVYLSLIERDAAPADEIQRFIMQSVWTMFAEELGLLTGAPFQTTVGKLRGRAEESAQTLGFLFKVLDQKGGQHRKGVLAGTRYVNGQLFADPAYVDLTEDELTELYEATTYDWSKVEPTIFGSLMERIIGGKLGAHYTHEIDIMKIVAPTIVRPWQGQLDRATTPDQALDVLRRLCAFRVLDPACGCGNFLYVAYREMRRLERSCIQRVQELAGETGLPLPKPPYPYVPLANFYGIEIEPAAVLIARVTLWMGHRQMMDECGDAEPPLPLVDLAGIATGDALFTKWPQVDCIVGNPPFVGDRKIRGELGEAYLTKLKKSFPSVGVVDYCAYWFRRAHEHLQEGQRAGLVSTNTLRENKHRLASLRYIVDNGGIITDAVSTQRWPGEAKVFVSLTNWVKQPTDAIGAFHLDGVEVEAIDAKLKAGPVLPEPFKLLPNRGRSFIGCQPTGEGFIVDEATAAALTAAGEQDVVRRYLTTDDIAEVVESRPSRWIVDFGTMPLEEAMKYPKSLAILRREVKPARDDDPELRKIWWKFWRPRPEMRRAIEPMPRYLVSTLTGKRLLFTWAEKNWCPSNLVGVFAFDDDYSMGILASTAFDSWVWNESSTMKDDLRFTPSTAFETFPWPMPGQKLRQAVADAAQMLIARRQEISRRDGIGLTVLYNHVDDGAYRDLVELQKTLDLAVADCYGWPRKVAQMKYEILQQLGSLNQAIGRGDAQYTPFPKLNSAPN